MILLKNSRCEASANISSVLLLSPAEFRKKVQTVMKQIYELVTLCDVPGCLIIRSPDCSQSCTWPETFDDVKQVLDLYIRKSGGIKRIRAGGGGGPKRGVRLDLLKQRLKGMSEDEKSRMIRECDVKIGDLRKRIEAAKVGSRGECEKVGTCNVLKGLFVNESSPRLLERVLVELKQNGEVRSTLGKRKFATLAENRINDDDHGWEREVVGEYDSENEKVIKHVKQLSVPQTNRLLREVKSMVENMVKENNHAEAGTLLTLGFGSYETLVK